MTTPAEAAVDLKAKYQSQIVDGKKVIPNLIATVSTDTFDGREVVMLTANPRSTPAYLTAKLEELQVGVGYEGCEVECAWHSTIFGSGPIA